MPAPTLDNYNAAITACTDAISAGDYAEARRQVAIAEGLRAGLAETMSGEGASASLGKLDRLAASIDAAEASAGQAAGRGRRRLRVSVTNKRRRRQSW